MVHSTLRNFWKSLNTASEFSTYYSFKRFVIFIKWTNIILRMTVYRSTWSSCCCHLTSWFNWIQITWKWKANFEVRYQGIGPPRPFHVWGNCSSHIFCFWTFLCIFSPFRKNNAVVFTGLGSLSPSVSFSVLMLWTPAHFHLFPVLLKSEINCLFPVEV